jgi:hypothetical protein
MFQQATTVELPSAKSPLTSSVVRANMTGNGSLAAAAQERLRASTYRGVRTVLCECHDDVLVLRGHVSSFYLKQLAQETVKHLAGIRSLFNCVEVVHAANKLRVCH